MQVVNPKRARGECVGHNATCGNCFDPSLNQTSVLLAPGVYQLEEMLCVERIHPLQNLELRAASGGMGARGADSAARRPVRRACDPLRRGGVLASPR